MKLRILISLGFLLMTYCSKAQSPSIQWQKSLGGTDEEIGYSSCNSKDGGYMIVGLANSYDGNVAGHKPFGVDDLWLIKLDSLGNINWSKCLGGCCDDEGHSISQTFDGGYILAGSTASNDGDVSGVHGLGWLDFWVVKVNNLGNIQWQKCLGSTSDDEANEIIQTTDSGYLVSGYTTWLDGDVTGFHGAEDIWVVKLTKDGVKQWTRSLGGSDYDFGGYCKQTSDGGYLIAGSTSSTDGDVSGLHGTSVDAWVVKLNSSGQIQWQKCYGGSSVDNAYAIDLSKDGGFFLSATTASTDGDVTGLHNSVDYWLVKADSVGRVVWEKCYGGTSFEGLYSANSTSDGGMVLIGVAKTDEGEVSGTHGMEDYWICKVDSLGNFQWGKALGGTDDDQPNYIMETPDGGYLATGYTISTDGDITYNHGNKDCWVVKLAPLGLAVPEMQNTLMELNIFQINDQINLKFFSKHNESAQLFLYDVTGKKVFEKSILVNEGINYNSVNCAAFARGMYFVKIDGEKGEQGQRIVIE